MTRGKAKQPDAQRAALGDGIPGARSRAGTTFVKAFGLSTGFDMPMRAVSIYQRDMPELAL